MSSKTEVNPNTGNMTELNPAIHDGAEKTLSEDTLLLGKYKDVEKMDVVSGEADLYVCAHEGEKYVAKIYRRKDAVDLKVIETLKTIEHQNVVAITDTGEHNGSFLEIMKFYKHGSLKGKKLEFNILKNLIIPGINEGLNMLHDKGIIHKDVKPSNIMVNDDNRSVAISDFGISSAVEEDVSIVLSEIGFTPGYSAPETFHGLYLEESDYYSLGIVLYELYTGELPFENMDKEEIARYISVQKIPYPKDMPQELKDLITGLTYPDVRYRNNKSNPNRRWTYKEVKAWLDSKPYVLPGEGAGGFDYKFSGTTYKDIGTLAEALAKNWDTGKQQVFQGTMREFFKGKDAEITTLCKEAEDLYKKKGDEDVIFWNLIWRLNPEIRTLYWKNRSYASLEELGNDIITKMWQNDLKDSSYWDSMLSNGILSNYMMHTAFDNDAVKAIKAIETSYKLNRRFENKKRYNYYLLGYMFSGKKTLRFCGYKFENIEGVSTCMKVLAKESSKDLEQFCHRIVKENGDLDPQFEAWLTAAGKGKCIVKWKKGRLTGGGDNER